MPLHVVALLGPVLAGGMVGSLLAGMIALQAAAYFACFPHDKTIWKLLVTILSLITATDWAVQFALLWEFMVAGFNNEEALTKKPRVFNALLILPVISALLAQSFFLHRSWKFAGRTNLVLIPVGVLVATSFATGLWSFATSFANDVVSSTRTNASVHAVLPALITWHVFTAFTDLVISAILSFELAKTRRDFRDKTDALLTTLTRASLSTAGFTAVISLTDAIIIAFQLKGSNAATPFLQLLPFAHALTSIYTLNLRAGARTVLNHTVPNRTFSSQQTPAQTQAIFNSARSYPPRTTHWDGTHDVHVDVVHREEQSESPDVNIAMDEKGNQGRWDPHQPV